MIHSLWFQSLTSINRKAICTGRTATPRSLGMTRPIVLRAPVTLPGTVSTALTIFEIYALFSFRFGSRGVTGSTDETSVGIAFGMTRVGFVTPVAECSSTLGAVCVCCAVGTDKGFIWVIVGVNEFFGQ